jgi:hypothetical protein
MHPQNFWEHISDEIWGSGATSDAERKADDTNISNFDQDLEFHAPEAVDKGGCTYKVENNIVQPCVANFISDLVASEEQAYRIFKAGSSTSFESDEIRGFL